MIQSDYHIHSTYCDGKASVLEMAQAAEKAGLKSIGFTSHLPLKYPNDWTMSTEAISNYLLEIKNTQDAFEGIMAIFTGMEIDYYLDSKGVSNLAKEIMPKLDFFIGSIHTMGCFSDGTGADIDYTLEIFTQGLQKIYGGNIQKLVKDYYGGIADMAIQYKPDIIGHFDLIKKNNAHGRFFNESDLWYRETWMDALKVIQKTDCIVEVNTGGMMRYGKGMLYPAIPMLIEILKMGIPITINADSHQVEGICYAYPETEALLKEIGFHEYRIFDSFQWNGKILS